MLHYEGQSKSFLNFFYINAFGAPRVRTVWAVLLVISMRKVLQRLRDAVRRKRNDKWQGQLFPRATYRLSCSNSSPRVTLLSSPNHRTFRISLRVNLTLRYSENGPQGDTYPNHEGHQIEFDGRTLEDSKSFPSELPTMTGSMEQLCMRKGTTSKVIK
jgi:hypothetical protein